MPPMPSALPPGPPPRKKNRLLGTGIGIAIALVAFFAMRFVVLSLGHALVETGHEAQIGECLAENAQQESTPKAVDCAGARYKVVGFDQPSEPGYIRLGGACGDFDTADAKLTPAGSEQNKVYCLEDLKEPGHRLPKVDDCLAGDAGDQASLKTADCATADFRVLAIEKGISVGLGGSPACSEQPKTGPVLKWTRGLGARSVCLQDLKNPNNHLPAVGDCMAEAADKTLSIVDCSQAKYRVLGTKPADAIDLDFEPCKEFPTAVAYGSWSYKSSPLNKIKLCLARR
ncbi:hypothetical protein D5S17_34400 [Pseudonocardiaceae bacterium YIM PH 21723]|nr:hypothetical protein D5S17_34400 [Pseudonocardiaceae bacterium YIM PH 21723]